MEANKNSQSVYEKPKLEIFHLPETDILSRSCDTDCDFEGEFIPFNECEECYEG